VQCCERALLPDDFVSDARLTWIRAAKKAMRKARRQFAHIVWDFVGGGT